MIVYFADRTMSVLGHATTNLPDGYVIKEDLKTEDVNTGVASFSCTIGFTAENRTELEVMTNAGNYLLRSNGNENEFYTIIESEIDTLRQEIYIYAEDAGLDLINEIADEFEASEAHAAEWYIDKYIIDSGFEIGINEIPASTQLKLKWEGQSTVTERIASIATQFGGYEIAYSFAIKGLEITHKYVNIYKQRGQDNGVQLRLNKEVDKIITSRSVANLATAFICTGGVPDDSDEAITLNGYEYDDGDFYVDANGKLKSRNAVAKWSRYVWNKEPNKIDGYEGHIVRPYSYNTTSKSELCTRAITELKKYCDMEVNFEANIKVLPAGVKIGDRVNIIDDAGGLYLSTRLLKLETSITEQKYTATLGEHLIKGSGISQKVADLAAQFSAYALSAERALKIANDAKESTKQALNDATTALATANSALANADSAGYWAAEALEDAGNALTISNAAEASVNRISDEVDNLGISIRNIGDTAQESYEKAYDAIEAAAQAQSGVESAYLAAQGAAGAANQAKAAADEAITQAATANRISLRTEEVANEAEETANSAKAESSQALSDVASLGTQLETLRNTMTADYSKKSDVTTIEATLQTQISQNAAGITSNASALLVIDETANDAQETAAEAQKLANAAQAEADKATAAAEAAQAEAAAAQAEAEAAQAEADKATAAAAEAQAAATQADAQLKEAQQNLEEVKNRVGATEEEITAAEEAVAEAQAAAAAAQAEAAAATESANAAQTVAGEATATAAAAQKTASDAAAAASASAALASEAKGDASEAKETAAAAQSVASQAQITANAAAETAENAQERALEAATNATNALAAANLADEKAASAQEELTVAKQNLEDIKSRVDATEEEITAAEKVVEEAQAAAEQAAADAAAAKVVADAAKLDAEEAQNAADVAQAAADAAKEAADVAKEHADAAQEAVDALAVRVVQAETDISQTAEAITLLATKAEVEETLGGYYTTSQTDAKIQEKANEITLSVSNTYAEASYVRQVNDTASEALQTANSASSGAESAYSSALAAAGAANKAQAAADSAQSQAENATSWAGRAESKADAAQDAADNLAIRVGTAETNITQTQNAIALVATKEEVTESLNGFYTKEELDAALEIKAGEITSHVGSTYATIENLNTEKAEIVAVATAAQETASQAAGDALKAQGDLAKAEKNLADVEDRVGASEKEIAAAKENVDIAKRAADAAKEAADAAKEHADALQEIADALVDRIDTAATWIEQTSEQIASFATKSEVEVVDGKFANYYTSAQTDAAITQKANEITQTVSSTYATGEYVRQVGDTAQESYEKAYDAIEAAAQAQSGAEGAYLAAQGAAGTANQAKAAAAAAQSTADTATNIANRAEGKADTAQDELTQVSATVTTHTTQIQSLDQSINLKASMTEVKDHLSENYYDKDYLESNFKVTPDSIISSVSHHFTTKEEFDNLEIGGANLLANSDVEIYGELTEGSTSAVVKYGDLMPAFDKYGLGVYTLSFDIKAVVEGENKATVFVSCGDGALTSKHTFPNRTISDVTGEYERRSFSFSPEIENDAGTNSMLKFQSGAGIYVKDVKLEKGTKPTPWTPASEDVYEKIDGVSESVDDIDERVTLAESTIQQLADAIRMLVIDSNGTTLLEQTGTGWTFNLASTQDQVSNIASGLDELSKTAGGTQNAVDKLKDLLDGENGIANTVSRIKVGEYVYTDDKGKTIKEPSLDFFASDSGFRLKITNTKILFTNGSENLVEINSKDKSLDIGKARIENELQISVRSLEQRARILGSFVWQARSNGNLGLIWKGANN